MPQVLPPHRLGGAHKRGAPYLSRRALLPQPKSLRGTGRPFAATGPAINLR